MLIIHSISGDFLLSVVSLELEKQAIRQWHQPSLLIYLWETKEAKHCHSSTLLFLVEGCQLLLFIIYVFYCVKIHYQRVYMPSFICIN